MAGRIDSNNKASWNLDFRSRAAESDEESDISSDEESLASEGSRITSTEETRMTLEEVVTSVTSTNVAPSSPPASAIRSSGDIALEATPPEMMAVIRKKPDDCHVVLRWSQLTQLIKENMVCSDCSNPTFKLQRRTIGIATEIDFSCKCRLKVILPTQIELTTWKSSRTTILSDESVG
jgi:hypothetical protein